MAIVVTNEGASTLIQWALQLATPTTPIVHLLGSPHALAHDDTQGTLAAAELVVSGYSPLPLSDPALNWTLAVYPDGYQATYTALNWQFFAACTVYGYWLSSGDLRWSLWGETLAEPVVIPGGGGPWTLIPYFYLASQPFTQGECG